MTETISGEIPISSNKDILQTRKLIREAATEIGFNVSDITRIVTAASELARNIYKYAGSGTVYYQTIKSGPQQGIQIVFEDQGPGIPDVETYLQEGFSTDKGLGMGLPGARKLMDDMEVDSRVNKGTRITVVKWLD